MARMNVRHLVIRPGAAGGLPRYFWQPSTALRAAGWPACRLPEDWDRHTDATALHAAAIAAAEAINARLDASRGAAPAPPPAAVPRTLAALIDDYEGSRRFAARRGSTQRGYRQCNKLLRAWGGPELVRKITLQSATDLHEAMARTPAFANATVRMLRLLLGHAQRLGWISSNPLLSFGFVDQPAGGVIWPKGAVDLFVTTADSMGHHGLGTAVLLNEWLGQREGDILRLPRAAIRADNTIIIRQSKTGATGALPLGMVPHLLARLNAELARHREHDAKPGARPASTLIVSSDRLPYKADNFRHRFAAVRAKMAETTPAWPIDYLLPGRDMTDPDAFTVRTEDLTFMALRHTAVTRLAEAGCELPEIHGITLHSLPTVQTILKRYMTRTAKLARRAFQRRMDAEGKSPATDKQSEVG